MARELTTEPCVHIQYKNVRIYEKIQDDGVTEQRPLILAY
jgi:hypothetical protein